MGVIDVVVLLEMPQKVRQQGYIFEILYRIPGLGFVVFQLKVRVEKLSCFLVSLCSAKSTKDRSVLNGCK